MFAVPIAKTESQGKASRKRENLRPALVFSRRLKVVAVVTLTRDWPGYVRRAGVQRFRIVPVDADAVAHRGPGGNLIRVGDGLKSSVTSGF